MRALEKKVPPVIVAGAAGLAMWWLSTVLPGTDPGRLVKTAVSGVLLVAAAVFGISAIIRFGRAGTTPYPHRPESASTLVTTGIYRVTRNPMYLGMALILTALAMWMAFPWSLLCVAGFVLYIDRFQIVPEERALTALFGDDYRRYRARVRRWL